MLSFATAGLVWPAVWCRMSGDLKRATGEMDLSFGSGPSSLGGMVGRKLANGRQSPTSPLKLFGHAKKKINDIFIDITEYINDGHAFLRGTWYDCIFCPLCQIIYVCLISLVMWTHLLLLQCCYNGHFFNSTVNDILKMILIVIITISISHLLVKPF